MHEIKSSLASWSVRYILSKNPYVRSFTSIHIFITPENERERDIQTHS